VGGGDEHYLPLSVRHAIPISVPDYQKTFLMGKHMYQHSLCDCVLAYVGITPHTCKYIDPIHVSTFKKSLSGLSQNVKRKITVLGRA
jgi:hypothetical protein